MKRAIWAAVLAVVSCAIVLGWRWYQNLAPDLEDIFTFDPTRYETTYALQEFRLKPHDRQWTLKSVTSFDASGEVESEQVYQLDEDGHSYYMNGDHRVYAAYIPRRGFQNVTGYLSGWDISRETYDNAGRIILREASNPNNTIISELVFWYYRTDQSALTGDEAVCAMVSISRIVTPAGEEPWMFDGNDAPIMEYTSYYITNYDAYGNETSVMEDGKCYLKTDADGYLQMIIREISDARIITRVDEFGRPLWVVFYNCIENMENQVIKYTIWEYEELE